MTNVITELIESGEVDTFYVGTHGNFDKMVYKILLRLSILHPIKIYVVLSSMPVKNRLVYKESIVPEGLENIPPRFGIDYRNNWMIKKADYVITYVHRSFGGAAKFKALAENNWKIVIYIV